MLFFNMMEHHHIHNEVTTFLNRQLPEQQIGRWGSTFWPPQSPDVNPFIFPVGLCERWGLPSANAHNPEQFEGLNMNSNCTN
jgi:hypothetical protein